MDGHLEREHNPTSADRRGRSKRRKKPSSSVSEPSHTRKSTQGARDSAVQSPQPDPPKENSGEQVASPEMTQALTAEEHASPGPNEVMQEAAKPANLSDVTHASASPEAAPSPAKPDEVAQETNEQATAQEAEQTTGMAEAATPRPEKSPSSPSQASSNKVVEVSAADEQTVEHALPQPEKAEHAEADTHVETPVMHDGTQPEEHLLSSEEREQKNEGGEGKEESEEEDEDDDTVLPYIQKRRFTFKGMSRPQRFISGLAIGQLLASALLILLNLVPQPPVPVQTLDGTIDIASGAFIAAVIFSILAWSFLLAGALHGPILMRLLVLGAFSYVLLQTPAMGIMIVARIVLLAVLWIWGLVVWLIERHAAQEREEQAQQAARHEQPSTQVQQDDLTRPDWGLYLPTFLPVLIILILYHVLYLGYFVTPGFAPSQALLLFSAVVEIAMRSLTLLLIPVLFLAGSDFAELGESLARSAGTLIGRFRARTPWPLALAIALLTLFIIERSGPAWTGSVGNWLADLFTQLAVGAVIIAVLCGVIYLARLWRRPASALHIKTRLLVLATLLTLVLGIYVPGAIAVWQSYVQHPATPAGVKGFTTYQQTDVQPNFSIAYPSKWVYKVGENDAALTDVIFVDPSTSGDFAVIRYPQRGTSFEDDLPQFLSDLCTPACTISFLQITTHGQWQVFPFSGQGKEGMAWMRDSDGQRWLLLGMTSPAYFNQAKPVYTTMVDSWTGGQISGQVQTTEVENTVNRVSSVLLVLVPLLASLLLASPFLLGRRKKPDIFAAGAVFFLVLGVVNLGYRLPDIAAAIDSRLHLVFGLSSMVFTVAVATLLVLGWLLFKRKITDENTRFLSLLLVLNGGLGFVALMVWIYGLALHNGLGDKWVVILQALLLVVALGWDIFTAGEITNRGGLDSPRHTRLLLFLGYIMLVATAVLYFSSQQTPGGKPLQELFFESENWPQFGLLLLGVPLVITTFILQVTYWWGTRDQEAGR